MNISYKWLSNYIDLSDITPEQLSEKLTDAGLEVDEFIDHRKIFENFVVGYVKEKKKHPNADKLSVCIVNDGSDDYNVVCGAPNVDAGQKIAFAKVGAVIPEGGFEIKKAKIRGEVSYGMICSERELGISEDHEGIMVLDDSLKEGTELSKALGLDDVVYDIDLTPNRADALSHIGVARDLAAILDRPLTLPKIELNEIDEKSEDIASVEIEDPDGCPRYVGKVVKDVTIKESPGWLKQNLVSIGLRPINNVVDVTNFILHEAGQPLHAFDLNMLSGKKIIVKQLGKDDTFITLDSKERKLKSDDLMICDAEKGVAIAGVMGGENSEVTDQTKDILIEAAYFNPSKVRRTAKRLGMSTDASYRFERGTDVENALWCAQRAAQLIAELGGGKICKGEIDVYPKKYIVPQIDVRYTRVNRILGFEISKERIDTIIKNLGFDIVSKNEEKLTVSVPAFRKHDIEREIDLIEEIVRIYGYQNVPEADHIAITIDEKVDQSAFTGNIRDTMISLGFHEIVTNSLLNEHNAELFGKSIGIMNPQTIEMSHTRTSLIPGALTTVSNNLKVREKNLRLFEVGSIFNKKTNGEINSFDDFEEEEFLSILLSGKEIESTWFAEDREYDFHDLKGIVEQFFEKLNLDLELKFNPHTSGNQKYKLFAAFTVNNKTVAEFGLLNEDILQQFDINQDVYLAEINLSKLKKYSQKEKRYDELLKYPKIIRDFAFILDKTITAEEVEKTIYEGSSNLLQNIKLFDIFESDSLGEGKKSLAFQLEYFDKSRTLTEEEVDKDFWRAIDKVKTKLNAQLRGG